MADEILQSLRFYLEKSRSIARTAEQLMVHQNTLRYRLEKYQELTGSDLADTETLAEVWWSLEYDHIRRRNPGQANTNTQ
jgi:DNA-binding PucR family transcriptional regulator